MVQFIELGGEAYKTAHNRCVRSPNWKMLPEKSAFSQMFSALTDGVRFNRNSGDASSFVIVTITCNRFM